jgi:hypothetical protein
VNQYAIKHQIRCSAPLFLSFNHYLSTQNHA